MIFILPPSHQSISAAYCVFLSVFKCFSLPFHSTVIRLCLLSLSRSSPKVKYGGGRAGLNCSRSFFQLIFKPYLFLGRVLRRRRHVPARKRGRDIIKAPLFIITLKLSAPGCGTNGQQQIKQIKINKNKNYTDTFAMLIRD